MVSHANHPVGIHNMVAVHTMPQVQLIWHPCACRSHLPEPVLQEIWVIRHAQGVGIHRHYAYLPRYYPHSRTAEHRLKVLVPRPAETLQSLVIGPEQASHQRHRLSHASQPVERVHELVQGALHPDLVEWQGVVGWQVHDVMQPHVDCAS